MLARPHDGEVRELARVAEREERRAPARRRAAQRREAVALDLLERAQPRADLGAERAQPREARAQDRLDAVAQARARRGRRGLVVRLQEAERAQPQLVGQNGICLLYTSPSPRDRQKSRMPSSA